MATYSSYLVSEAGGGSGSSLSAWEEAKKVLAIQAKNIDIDAGGNATDPFQIDALVTGFEKAAGLAKNRTEQLDAENMVATYKKERANLSSKQTKSEITGALTTDSKEIKYRYGNQFANDPLSYLSGVVQSQMAILDMAASYADQLEDDGRIAEADALRNNLKTPTEEIAVYNAINDLYDTTDPNNPVLKEGIIDERVGSTAADELKNYAVVYKTDAMGRVMDMNVRRRFGATIAPGGSDEIASGSVVPLMDSNNNPVTMNGIQVFVNKQDQNGQTVVKLGNVSATLITSSNMYDVGFGDTANADVNPPTNVAKILDKNFKGGDDINFRSAIVPLTPATANTPGMYAVTSGGRVFRQDLRGKWDEISKDALSSFPDYNESSALKLEALGVEHIRNNAGVLITPQHLNAGYNPFDPNSPNQSMSPASVEAGAMSRESISKPAPFGGAKAGSNMSSFANRNAEPGGWGTDQLTGIPGAPTPTGPQPNGSQPGVSLSPTPQNMSVETRVNRQSRVLPAGGSEKFNQTSRQLFSGKTGA